MKTKTRAERRLIKEVEVLRALTLDVARACRGLAPVTEEVRSVLGSAVSRFLENGGKKS